MIKINNKMIVKLNNKMKIFNRLMKTLMKIKLNKVR